MIQLDSYNQHDQLLVARHFLFYPLICEGMAGRSAKLPGFRELKWVREDAVCCPCVLLLMVPDWL